MPSVKNPREPASVRKGLCACAAFAVVTFGTLSWPAAIAQMDIHQAHCNHLADILCGVDVVVVLCFCENCLVSLHLPAVSQPSQHPDNFPSGIAGKALG